MTARLSSDVRRALQAHRTVSLHALVQPEQPLNRAIARLNGRGQVPNKLLLPAWENGTGNLSREHVKHKYKRPGCRF